MGDIMDNAFKMIGDLVKGLTGILIGVVALGAVSYTHLRAHET